MLAYFGCRCSNVLAPRLLHFETFSSSDTDEAGTRPWESSEPKSELRGWACGAIAAAEAAAKRAGLELKSEARAELAPKEVSERDEAAEAETRGGAGDGAADSEKETVAAPVDESERVVLEELAAGAPATEF